MAKYKLVLRGGSIGEAQGRKPEIYDTKEEAQKEGKSYVKSFSGGFRNYYRPGYNVVLVKAYKRGLTDYGIHLLDLFDVDTARIARIGLETRHGIKTQRFYQQLGFATKQKRERAFKLLRNSGIVAIKV